MSSQYSFKLSSSSSVVGCTSITVGNFSFNMLPIVSLSSLKFHPLSATQIRSNLGGRVVEVDTYNSKVLTPIPWSGARGVKSHGRVERPRADRKRGGIKRRTRAGEKLAFNIRF